MSTSTPAAARKSRWNRPPHSVAWDHLLLPEPYRPRTRLASRGPTGRQRARCSCTSRTAIEPSPTAEATRLPPPRTDTLALEPIQARYGQPAVPRTGRDHDGPGACTTTVGTPDDVRPVLALQRGRLDRDTEPGTELSALDNRPLSQLTTGDAARKAEIVLDAGGCAGLGAGRDRVEQDRVQPLGRTVDRGREPGRPGADHEEITDLLRGGLFGHGQSGYPGQLGVAGIAQHLVAEEDHHRSVVGRDA